MNPDTYTVKALSKLSNVSVRALHYYDEIDLLKPAYLGANNYRYYLEEQLLMLQQILFYKELGFGLKKIKEIISRGDFNKISALISHRAVVEKDIALKRELLQTLDKTILHLRGKQTMSNEELYKGFDPSKQKEYEKYIVKQCGSQVETLLAESHRRTAKWDKDEWDGVKNAGDTIHKDLAKAITAGLSPESDEVQEIIQQHYTLQNRFFDLTKEVYIGLSQLYSDHPDFGKFFEVYHPKMIEYIGKAMRFYAEKNL